MTNADNMGYDFEDLNIANGKVVAEKKDFSKNTEEFLNGAEKALNPSEYLNEDNLVNIQALISFLDSLSLEEVASIYDELNNKNYDIDDIKYKKINQLIINGLNNEKANILIESIKSSIIKKDFENNIYEINNIGEEFDNLKNRTDLTENDKLFKILGEVHHINYNGLYDDILSLIKYFTENKNEIPFFLSLFKNDFFLIQKATKQNEKTYNMFNKIKKNKKFFDGFKDMLGEKLENNGIQNNDIFIPLIDSTIKKPLDYIEKEKELYKPLFSKIKNNINDGLKEKGINDVDIDITPKLELSDDIFDLHISNSIKIDYSNSEENGSIYLYNLDLDNLQKLLKQGKEDEMNKLKDKGKKPAIFKDDMKYIINEIREKLSSHEELLSFIADEVIKRLKEKGINTEKEITFNIKDKKIYFAYDGFSIDWLENLNLNKLTQKLKEGQNILNIMDKIDHSTLDKDIDYVVRSITPIISFTKILEYFNSNIKFNEIDKIDKNYESFMQNIKDYRTNEHNLNPDLKISKLGKSRNELQEIRKNFFKKYYETLNNEMIIMDEFFNNFSEKEAHLLIEKYSLYAKEIGEDTSEIYKENIAKLEKMKLELISKKEEGYKSMEELMSLFTIPKGYKEKYLGEIKDKFSFMVIQNDDNTKHKILINKDGKHEIYDMKEYLANRNGTVKIKFELGLLSIEGFAGSQGNSFYKEDENSNKEENIPYLFRYNDFNKNK